MAHPDNAFYGHNRVLSEYAGLGSTPPMVRAHIQHGWSETSGLPQPARLVPWIPKLLWNDRNRKVAHEAGVTRVDVIGAPFCYLDAISRPAEPGPRSTIYYPYHGWERDDLRGSHDDLVAAIHGREKGPVTVCLYWHEFDLPAVRRTYDDAGFRVICHGYRSDPQFAIRQRDELLRHDKVASNRVGSALWYGGFLGRSIEVFGPIFTVEDEREARTYDEFQQAEWPGLFSGGIHGAEARAMASAELGADHVLQPAELRRILGWEPPPTRRAASFRVAVLAEHHVRRIAYNVAARLPRSTPLPRF